MYVLWKVVACNMQFVNDYQQNLLWQHIALKTIVAVIMASTKQCGHCVIVSAIGILQKCTRTCIESWRLLCNICESRNKNAK